MSTRVSLYASFFAVQAICHPRHHQGLRINKKDFNLIKNNNGGNNNSNILFKVALQLLIS